jgi:hypothetical protein
MSISITDQDVFTALVTFFGLYLPGIPVVQAQDNRVPMPIGGFVMMNNTSQTRLSTNVPKYNAGSVNPGAKEILTATKYGMQLDFYGPDSASWAMQTQTLFRDEFATDAFPANIQPLYADDPMQMPLIDGEDQYEQRWKVSAFLQYNPIITVGQDFAAALTVEIASVDVVYPP